jgi:hypothetical protein
MKWIANLLRGDEESEVLVWIAVGLLVGGVVFTLIAFWFRRWWLRVPLLILATPFLLGGGYLLWFENRWQPVGLEETWFEGVTYSRVVRQHPRPIVLHVVRVDLDAPGIDVLVTPPAREGGLPLNAQTTSGFVQEHKVQVAINGGFFHPWHAKGPFDYYPHVDDPVTVFGLSVSGGKEYTKANDRLNSFFFTKSRKAFFGQQCDDAEQAVTGQEIFVRQGQYSMNPVAAATYKTHEPRTSVALSKNERKLLLFVVDGRQPGYSEGVTLEEMAELIGEHGGWTALHLDGGGSSTLAREGENGTPVVVNWPIHGRHPPGRERPVANHLGIYAKRR